MAPLSTKNTNNSLHKKLQSIAAAIGGAVLLATWAYTTLPTLYAYTTSFLHPKVVSQMPQKLNHYISSSYTPDASYTLSNDTIHNNSLSLPNTFYDDPSLSYSIGDPIKDWDQKRAQWLKQYPLYAEKARNRVLMVTGSQASPCESRVGDFYLLRLFKNKVDYCRIQGYEIFYNNAFLEPKMYDQWAKPAVIRAAMMAHPETEWIWWVDSDAVITDMEFKLPLEKYKNFNLVLDGYPDMVFKDRSWLGINAGVILFRNCQWTMDFLNAWASMGPKSPDYEKWGQHFRNTFTDVKEGMISDQTVLVYLVLKHNDTWGDKIHYEKDYDIQGYWRMVLPMFKNIGHVYVDIEKKVPELRKRHAEIETEYYGALRNEYLEEGNIGKFNGKRTFVTHFVGCSPCSGTNNVIYSGHSCRQGLELALNIADNQVLRNFGFVRHEPANITSWVLPLAFDTPGEIDVKVPN